MPQPKHIFFALLLGLGILGPGGTALAQDTNIIGPPVLRDFTISGERPVSPPPAEQPANITPPPVEVPAQSITPAEALPEAPPAPVESATQSAPGQERRDVVRGPSDAAPAPVASARAGDSPVAEGPSAPGADATEGPQPASAIPASETGMPWLYIFLGVVGAGLALLIVRRLRKSLSGSEAEAPVAEEPLLLVEPVPVAPALRPWLELEFKPGKAAATNAQASVEYELKISNVGGADARKVRIEARLFNAQQDHEIGAFFSAPDPTQATAAPRVIPPQGGAVFRSVVALPTDEVREVIVQGRRLFIPMVAFNVLYEWGEGETGQTSMSYIVGRETEPPAEKMAPFRLDLGPRIYRSVGFRPSKLALTV